ncbi:hypothetical protein AZ09_14405 [Acetobacter aceti 1023]|nr:hypothetical protein AZ09_14405 [Acetobacter aceti 1023]
MCSKAKLMERSYNPYIPSAAERGKLAGYYKVKVGDFRLIYDVIDKKMIILVVLLDKRENGDAYS